MHQYNSKTKQQYLLTNAVQMSVRLFFKELNTFIQQWCINCIKCDRKDIYNFTIEFYSKQSILILNFL